MKKRTARNWDDANAHHRGRPCRVCGAAENVHLHHTAGRSYDVSQTHNQGPVEILWVDPISVVPVCADCHERSHQHTLDLLPHLTYDEQAFVVKCLGIVRALKRLTPAKEAA